MSTKASVRSFFSAPPPASIDLRRSHHLDRARTIILDGYGAVYRYIARAAHRTATPEEPAAYELHDIHGPQGTTPGGEPESHSDQPVHNHNNNHEHASEAVELEEPIHRTEGGEHDAEEALHARRKHTWIWMALVIVGVLALIVTPGLILGLVTGQLSWGIALSGAIATVVSFIAGIYYHISK